MISGESSCEQKQRAAVTNLNLRSSHNPTPERKTQYETPALSELQRLVWSRGGSDNHVDQVWPNLYLGDAWAARSKSILQSLGITHILNAADGPYNINTGARYYRDLPIQYYGVQAFDDNSFDISVFFREAADFIHKALNTAGGKVIVHCARGLSRSATLVLAYLMIHENLTLVEALKSVDSRRSICPNTGFLSQLQAWDIKLNNEKEERDNAMAKGH
ncbi:dual specificity protein phosphatase 13B-like [Erythrolamprus reginae]|uniref:dual specificity protein phosphatase 13B-like n=1 Tax=Erythrolamprus reginae TaxID=121349 RepID=UPI00396C3263